VRTGSSYVLSVTASAGAVRSSVDQVSLCVTNSQGSCP
jgi:hypothetical protein